jgi:hypothetical protein
MRFGILVLALALTGLGAGRFGQTEAQSAVPPESVQEEPVADIQTYQSGLGGVHAANRRVQLSLGRDPSLPDEAVLIVDYPDPTDDPAGRDVRCDAETHDWSGGRAIAFQIKPSQALRLSVSFLDRNNVVYTTWVELKGDVWQPVRIAFDDLRPNPYFQPPDAKQGSPLDVSDVKFIAFAPQDRTSGRLAISKFVVMK